MEPINTRSLVLNSNSLVVIINNIANYKDDSVSTIPWCLVGVLTPVDALFHVMYTNYRNHYSKTWHNYSAFSCM